MKVYKNKISSLEEKAVTQVAINLCQEYCFKEVALHLEKPTYADFIPYEYSPFVSDPKKLSIWEKMKKCECSLNDFAKSCEISNIEVRRWEASINKQCQRLTDMIPLPRSFRQGVHAWMNRIALEYLSYSRRQEVLFGVSRYFLMNIFTREAWKDSGRLDEMKLAQRLLEDERLTLLQRYRIACVYCLHERIPQLWKRLTQEEKRYTSGNCDLGGSGESHDLVLLWSRHMSGNRENPWYSATFQAIYYGNRTALMLCWKMLKESVRKKKLIHMALETLRTYRRIYPVYNSGSCNEKIVSDYVLCCQRDDDIKELNLPFYYSELIHFFLSQMDEKQQLKFFKRTFEKEECEVLQCFFDWPLQDEFLSTINRLWGIIPKGKYGTCLSTLENKCIRNDEIKNRYYDYISLLGTLWEQTPEEYKQYVFYDKDLDIEPLNEGGELLFSLIERSPFRKDHEALFKQVFRDQPQEKRREIMLSVFGEDMCSNLIKKEKWSFLNWFLEECLPQEEIPDFKKKFIRSYSGVRLCLDVIEENRERLVEDILDWSLKLDTEKMQWKESSLSFNALMNGYDWLDTCVSHFRAGNFAEVDRVINFCSPSDEQKKQFKNKVARYACEYWLRGHDPSFDCIYKHMSIIVAWSHDTEEKIRDFKKDLFSDRGIDAFYDLVFWTRIWVEAECFYQFFDLSPEEIKKLKKDTVFYPDVISDIRRHLTNYNNSLVASLRLCLTDEEMVIDLKKEVKATYYRHVLDESEEKELEQLDHLVSELLDGFRKEVQDKTSREGDFVKDNAEERSFTLMEGESSSPRKPLKGTRHRLTNFFTLRTATYIICILLTVITIQSYFDMKSKNYYDRNFKI